MARTDSHGDDVVVNPDWKPERLPGHYSDSVQQLELYLSLVRLLDATEHNG